MRMPALLAVSGLIALGSARSAISKDPLVWAQDRLAAARAALDAYQSGSDGDADPHRLQVLRAEVIAAESVARDYERQIRRSGEQHGFKKWHRGTAVRDVRVPRDRFGNLQISSITTGEEHDVVVFSMRLKEGSSQEAGEKNNALIQLILHQESGHAQHQFLIGGSLGRISSPRFEIGDVSRAEGDPARNCNFVRDNVLVRIRANGNVKADELARTVDDIIRASPLAESERMPKLYLVDSSEPKETEK